MATLEEKLRWTVSCLSDAKSIWGQEIEWSDLSISHQGSCDEGEIETGYFCLNSNGEAKVRASHKS